VISSVIIKSFFILFIIKVIFQPSFDSFLTKPIMQTAQSKVASTYYTVNLKLRDVFLHGFFELFFFYHDYFNSSNSTFNSWHSFWNWPETSEALATILSQFSSAFFIASIASCDSFDKFIMFVSGKLVALKGIAPLSFSPEPFGLRWLMIGEAVENVLLFKL